MIGESGQVRGSEALFREQTRDDRLAVAIEEALADNAAAAEANGIGIGLRSQQVAHDAADLFGERTEAFGDQGVEGGGGLDHLAGDEFPMPGAGTRVEEAEEEAVDERAEPLGRGGPGGETEILGVLFEGSVVGVPEDLAVELLLAAEVVIDGGDVGPGALTNGADGGGSEAGFGEDLAGGVQEGVTGGGRG